MSTLAAPRTRHDHHGTGELNRGHLAKELKQVVRGEVRFDDASRHLYANDASIYRFVPVGVVIPRDEEDVVAAVEVCRRHHAPIHARGGGTGLAGQTVNKGVVIDFSKYMNRILSLDPDARTARVQPGVICDDVREAAFEHGLTFAPDPATHDHNTLGGMIGNNSCGTHSVYGGKTVDNVLELDVLLYDGTRLTLGVGEEERLQEVIDAGGRRGEIYAGLRDLRDTYAGLIRERYPDVPRRVSGYNLDDLLPEKGFNPARALVGSESTCVLVLSATLRLLPWPPKHTLVALGYPDSPAAAEHVMDMLDTDPVGLEFFEYGVLDNLHRKHFPTTGEDRLPPGHTFVFVEYGGRTQEESDTAAHHLVDRLEQVGDRSEATVISEPDVQDNVWKLRKGAIGSTKIPGEHAGYAGWEDAAVRPSRLSDYLRDFRKLVDGYGYHTVLFGHFGQGCIHNRLDLDIATQSGIDTFGRFLSDAADLVVRYGGSLSGEHGDGQLRAAFLPRMFGPELVTAFERFKDLFDPDGSMNPGKVVRPNSPVDDLREGVDYRPPDLATHFSFAEDGGWAGAADRCFGVGKCRHMEGGTMCPSFMVTREEKHSTRGRARMLFEMMQTAGERKDPWRDDGVKDALDLCLACKGCKGDCPVRVDMATYKAEFLSHYYEGRLRPRTAYAMGLIQQWARLAAIAPGVVNRLGSWPVTGSLLKAVAGVARDRQVPQFASRTFRSSVDRSRLDGAGAPALLWTDTFTNHFQPPVAQAALRVLDAAGFAVQLPDRHLCCGRPLYDYGMLPTARRYLERVLDALRPQVEAGIPVVGLEPSCVAVFRDELPGMLPDDPLARRLSEQTLTLAELLDRHAPSWQPPALHRKALVQVHCHQGAVVGFDTEEALLRRIGLDLDIPDSGCCGMAGSFGYEAGERYDVSIACGERVILPKVRDADERTLIVADGFSCREQIEQNTGRQALHLAQVLDLAMSSRQPEED